MTSIQRNPLVISELLEKIFANLEYRDLYSCLTVNHQWSSEASRALFTQFYKDINFIKEQLEWIEKERERLRGPTNDFTYSGIKWGIRFKFGYEIIDIYKPVNQQIDNLVKLHMRLARSSELHKIYY